MQTLRELVEESKALKPCPFCGSTKVKTTHCFADSSRRAVQCMNCDVRTNYYNTVKEAKAVWNSRVMK